METHSNLNAPNTNNATWIDYTEETEGYWDYPTNWYRPIKYRYFQHLAEINKGRKRGGDYWNDPYHTFQANRDLIDAVGSQLDLLPRQKEVASAWFTYFDLDEWGMRADLIACCLCSRVVHEDESNQRRTHPNVSDEDKPPEFAELPDRFGLPEKDVTSMYGKVDSYLREKGQPRSRKFDRRRTDERKPQRMVTPAEGN